MRMGPLPIPLAERFDKYHMPEPNSGCWLWFGATVQGYGVIRNEIGAKPRLIKAHRFSYQLHSGAIPEGNDLDHICQNRSCVNPEHLQPLTRKAHIKCTRDRQLRIGCKHGHEMDAKNTWIDKTGARHCRRCRARVEVNRRNKLKIASGKDSQ